MQPTNRQLLLVSASALTIYCLVVTVLTGDVGFEGDDWWILSWPYWNSFPQSIWIYAKESLRPMEGVYWITIFELFGFNKIVFHLCSLLLLAGGSVLMGASLMNSFPKRSNFAVLSVFFAFFLPTVSCLTYVLATDNSRLSLLLFWASVLAFQRWRMRSRTWPGLCLPVSLYVCSFLTYEAAGFLIAAVPFLLLPIHMSDREALTDRSFAVKIASAISLGFIISLGIRFTLLSGGAVGHRHLLPPTELLWSYIALLPHYLMAPFTNAPWDAFAFGLGIAVAVTAGVILFRLGARSERGSAWFEGSGYIIAVGLLIALLGFLPYQLAGYGNVVPKLSETVAAKWGFLPGGNTAWFNFNWSSRIYSAGSFGIAIILAGIFTSGNGKVFRTVSCIAAAVLIAAMTFFHAGLSNDWKEAAQKRNNLVRSLISNVPDVKPGSNLVFLDLESYHKRAAVFRGWGGLRELVRMLYCEQRLGAFYLYPYCWKWPNLVFHRTIVTSNGFVSRGMKLDNPVPLDSLVLLNRNGDSLSLMEGINSHDGVVPTGIIWKGVNSISSNPMRILAWSDEVQLPRKLVRNAWNSGLISTLNLNRVTLSFKILNRWTTAMMDTRIGRKSLLKK